MGVIDINSTCKQIWTEQVDYDTSSPRLLGKYT